MVDSHLDFSFSGTIMTLFVNWNMSFHLSGVKSLFFSNTWPVFFEIGSILANPSTVFVGVHSRLSSKAVSEDWSNNLSGKHYCSSFNKLILLCKFDLRL